MRPSTTVSGSLQGLPTQGQGARQRLRWGLERRLRSRAQLLRKEGKDLGPVVCAYGEMSDDVYVIAEAVAEELSQLQLPLRQEVGRGSSLLPQPDLPILGARR